MLLLFAGNSVPHPAKGAICCHASESGSLKMDCILCLPFTELATTLNPQSVCGNVSSRAAEPGQKELSSGLGIWLSAQDDENDLRNLLSQIGVFDLAQSDRINQIDMLRYE